MTGKTETGGGGVEVGVRCGQMCLERVEAERAKQKVTGVKRIKRQVRSAH